MDGNTLPLSAVILCDRHTADEFAVEPWPLRAEGRRALDHLTGVIASQVEDCVLVTRAPLCVFGWNGLIAAPPGSRAWLLEALHTGLKLIRHAQALVFSLDTPWAQAETIALLRSALQPGWDAILPQLGKRPVPFPALYSKGSVQRIELHLERGVPGVHALIDRLRSRPVSEKKLRQSDPRLRSFEALEPES